MIDVEDISEVPEKYRNQSSRLEQKRIVVCVL